MANFLAIETATDVCGVAVLKDNLIVIEMILSKPRAHSENLVLMISKALSYADLNVKDLSGIVVSKGPGSYTGLRIGVSVAKGLAFSHKIDLIGVPSLSALATATLPFANVSDTIVLAFNSRRNEVYLGIFAVNQQHPVLKGTRLESLTKVTSQHKDNIASFILKKVKKRGLTKKLIIAGEGAVLVNECLGRDFALDIELVPSHIVCPSASVIATLGAARHKNGQIDNLSSFEPFYLNEFIPKSQKKSIFERLPF